MKIENKPLRYAHAEGHTDVCFTDEGRHIITCGNDGDVRIWAGIEDDDPNSHCVGEIALAISYKDRRLYVATDNHAVQAYSFPAFDKDGIVTRFTAPVTQITSSPNSEALGCSSENMEAKVCSPEGGAPIFTMSDHKGPVLSVAVCPNTKYASTACGDGKLRIWDIDTQKCVKEIDCVPKINTFYAAKVLCRMDFEPTEGKYLAYPNNREIVIADSNSWSQRMTFTHSTIKCAISQCKYSPCGKFLAGSTVAGQIASWEVDSGKCIGIVEHPTSHNVTSMAWDPTGNGVLVYCDVAGQLGMLLNCYGVASNANENSEDVEMIERDEDNDGILDNLIENYQSDDDNGISIEKIKNETLGVISDDEVSRPPTREQRSNTVAQKPMQPSATPVSLEHRYMCWNDIGIVRCHTQENGDSTIEVEFHDANFHHSIHLNNYLNHTMASLSSTVLALACETPSKVVCISLVGSSKEWSVSLSEMEEALCVSASSAVVAVGTSSRLVRLFTIMGTQRQVISLSGPIVSLGGFGNMIMATYHSSEPGITDQHMSMDIIAMNGRQIRSKTVPVPLTSGSKICWLGCSDAGSPCLYDSSGIVRLFDMSSGVWMPICETNDHSKGASDNWFIVSVCESSQKIRAILCRGTSFPPTAPKPIITELPIQIPLCEMDLEKSQYEEQLVRWAHTTSDVDVKAARETAIKLFALACRSEIEQRALELMELLKDDRLLPLAAKYASRLGRIHLAEKLTNLSESWENESEHLNVGRSHFNELDTQETYDVTNADEDVNSSLIIQQKPIEKKVENENTIKPVPIRSSPGGPRNPFKKQLDSSKLAQSPLSLTERSLVEVHSNGDHEENMDPLTPLSGEAFSDWYARNKSLLEQQHAEMTPSELARQSVRTFKSLQLKKDKSTDSSKRKLDEVDETVTSNTPKQSKLSAFAFSKQS